MPAQQRTAPTIEKPTKLKAFEFVDTANGALDHARNPVETRRRRFIETIEKQERLFQDPAYTEERIIIEGEGADRVTKRVQKRPRSWLRKDGDTYYVTVRYGVRPVAVVDGKHVAKLEADQVMPFFTALKEATEAGAFDEQFAKLSKRSNTDADRA
jgi:hypothetical protein